MKSLTSFFYGTLLLLFSSPLFGQALPTREVVDTREVSSVGIMDSVAEQMYTMADEAFPKEVLMCLYGKFDASTKQLVADAVVLAKVDSTSIDAVYPSGSLKIICSQERFVGIVHTHPGFNYFPSELRQNGVPWNCFPTTIEDYMSFMWDDTAAFMGVYCRNGWIIVQLRTGGWAEWYLWEGRSK